MLDGWLRDIERFNREIIGLTPPDRPTVLDGPRRAHAIRHLEEEVQESRTALTIEDQADALLDLIYVAGGRLFEMGIAPGPAFEEVHLRNMARVRGVNPSRPDSAPFDAVKPQGWTPPDLTPMCTVTRDELLELYRSKARFRKPRILVLGYGRHGKDTVCGLLQTQGLRFTSSSMFCAEHVVFPVLGPKYGYADWMVCYEDRHNHRAEWFDLIGAYNQPDGTRLTREILQTNDIYCGMRRHEELVASRSLFDVVVWVDASKRLPPEDQGSCTVAPHMADLVLDNNGDVEHLQEEVIAFCKRLRFDGVSRWHLEAK